MACHGCKSVLNNGDVELFIFPFAKAYAVRYVSELVKCDTLSEAAIEYDDSLEHQKACES